MSKRGRKKKEEYYKTKKIDEVVFEEKTFIINLPIPVPEIEQGSICIGDAESRILLEEPSNITGYQKDGNFARVVYTQTDNRVDIKPVLEPVNTSLESKNYPLSLIPGDGFIDANVDYKTDINCWWCCHKFDRAPIFMPMFINSENRYKVKGIFCSFECCYAYLHSNLKYRKNKFLLNNMFKDITKKIGTIDDYIKRAPPRESLKMFGGPLDINQFRSTNVDIALAPYPQIYVPDMVVVSEKRQPPVFSNILPVITKQKNLNNVPIMNNLNKILQIR
jgi:hypothetical protein